MNSMSPARWHVRRGWLFVFVVAALLVIIGVFLLFSPVDSADFESETGIVWDDFSSESPEVADYLAREARLLAVSVLALGAVVASLAATLVRGGNRTAWLLLWVLPATLALYALVFLSSGAGALSGFYAGGAAIAVLATAASIPRRV